MEEEFLICEHMSVSRKQLWETCPLAYKYRYHLKTVTNMPIQPYFTYGKYVHKIAEIYVKEQGKKPIELITRDVLEGKILIEKDKLNPVLEKEYKNKLAGHVKNIKTLTDKIGFDGHLEWPFRHDLEPPNNLLVVGFIDRLIIRKDKYFILDYKTTKKGFWRKNNNTIRSDLQLRVYARIVQKHFDAKVENIKAALYYLEGGELVATNFNEESVASAEEDLAKTYKKIISTKPNDVCGRIGDHCRRCEYRVVCPAYSLV